MSERRLEEIPIHMIDPFPDHPFKVQDDEDMDDLIESIRSKGVLMPCIVRPKKDGRYELIAGHRRKYACEQLGIENLWCEVMELTGPQATILMVESNFQRDRILPSEKAFAYKMRLDAMKKHISRLVQNQKGGFTFAGGSVEEELEEAVRLFGTLSGYKDADKQLFICQNKLQKLLAKEEARRLKQRQKGLEPTEESAPEERKRPKYYWASRIALMMSCFVLAGVMIGIALPLLRKKPVEGSQPVADATQLAALPTAASPTETSAATAAPTATAKATSAPTSTPIVVELQPGRAMWWSPL